MGRNRFSERTSNTASADRASLSGRVVSMGGARHCRHGANDGFHVSLGVYVLVPFGSRRTPLAGIRRACRLGHERRPDPRDGPPGLAIDRYGERRVVALTMVAMAWPRSAPRRLRRTPISCCYCFWPRSEQATPPFSPAERGDLAVFPPHCANATGVRQAGLPLGAVLAAITLPVWR